MSARVLFATNLRPWPAYGGQFIRTLNLIDSLRQHFELAVLSSPPAADHDRADVAWFAMPTGQLRERFSALFRPASDWGGSLARALADFQPTVVWFDYAYWGPYAAQAQRAGARTVLDRHNVQPRITRQRVATTPWGTRYLAGWGRYAAEIWHERRWLPDFDRLVCVSAQDAAYYARFVPPGRLVCIPNYVNEAWYNLMPLPPRAAATVVITAQFHSFQNLHGARWFLTQVWPAVRAAWPTAEVQLVGEGAELLAPLAGAGGIVVGRVPSVTPYLRAGTVAAVPILHGSGSRLKVLEALACEIPLVSTRLGAEGIDLTPGENGWLVEDAAEFAQAVLRLLADADLRGRLARQGLALLRRDYAFPVNTARVQAVIQSLLPSA